jgi:muramoyltetrapeptide carboxypeptidase
MIKPPRLRPGATIGVANVSGPVDEARLDAGLDVLRSRGYEVVEAGNLRQRDGFLAGNDAVRAAGYLDLVRRPDVDAIFFARGGYGAARAVPRLDPEALRSFPKIHLGGSDLTALFAFLGRHASQVTFYGPMVAVQIATGSALDWEQVLSGAVPPPHEIARQDVVSPGDGAAEGPLVGGCLSLLASLCGTTDAVEGKGAILFWEDVGEEIYRLDRMLTQLERSGTFEGLQGMLIGSVTPGPPESARRMDVEPADEIRAWLARRFARAAFPVVVGFPVGHLDDTRTIPLGLPVRMDLARGVIEFSGAAVE